MLKFPQFRACFIIVTIYQNLIEHSVMERFLLSGECVLRVSAVYYLYVVLCIQEECLVCTITHRHTGVHT